MRATELGIPVFVLKNQIRLSRPWAYLKGTIEIYKLIKNENPRIVHLTMPYSVLVSIASVVFNRKPKYVWFQHGPVGGKLDYIASLAPISGMIFNSSFTYSQHLKKSLLQNYKAKLILPLGTKILGLKENISHPIKIAMIGRICSGKDQLFFLKNIVEMMNSNHFTSNQVQFLIVGTANSQEDRAYDKSLKTFVFNNKMTEYVTFIDHQKDLTELYSQIDILVHVPKLPEAFGLVIAEAMARGVTVIASASGGSIDLIPNDQMAYVVSEENREQLSNILRGAIQDHLDQNKIVYEKRQLAFEHIKNNYSEEQMLERIESFYNDL